MMVLGLWEFMCYGLGWTWKSQHQVNREQHRPQMRARIKFNLLVRRLFPNLEHASWFNFSIPDVRVVLIELIKLMTSRLPESKCLRINVLRSLVKLLCVVIFMLWVVGVS